MALQDYTKTVWENGSQPAINSSNLNNIENGVERVTVATQAIETRVATVENKFPVSNDNLVFASEVTKGGVKMYVTGTTLYIETE